MSDSDSDSDLSLEAPDIDLDFGAVNVKLGKNVGSTAAPRNTGPKQPLSESIDSALPKFHEPKPPTKWVDGVDDIDAEEAEWELRQEMGTQTDDLKVELDPLGLLSDSDPLFTDAARPNRNKTDIYSAHFDPVYFLRVAHKNTSYAQLQQGLTRLGHTRANRAEKMRALVQQHFGQFVHCKDTIDLIQQLLRPEVAMAASLAAGEAVPPSQCHTARVGTVLGAIQEKAGALYAPLMRHRDEVQRIRVALHTVRKLRVLLELPGRLQRHIAANEPAQVVLDYRRLRSLRLPPDSPPLLHAVVSEAQAACSAYAAQLAHRLADPRVSLEQHQRLMAYLADLDYSRHPAWEFLDRQGLRLCASLDRCWARRQQQLREVDALHTPHSPAWAAAVDAVDLAACERLLSLLSATFPAFLRLAYGVTTGAVHALSQSGLRITGEVDALSVSRVTALAHRVAHRAATYLRAAVLPPAAYVGVADEPSDAATPEVPGAPAESRTVASLDLAGHTPPAAALRVHLPPLPYSSLLPPPSAPATLSSLLPDQAFLAPLVTSPCSPADAPTTPTPAQPSQGPCHVCRLTPPPATAASAPCVCSTGVIRLSPALALVLPGLTSLCAALLALPLCSNQPGLFRPLADCLVSLSAFTHAQVFRNACVATMALPEPWAPPASPVVPAPATRLPLLFVHLLRSVHHWLLKLPPAPVLCTLAARPRAPLPTVALMTELWGVFADRLHAMVDLPAAHASYAAAAHTHARVLAPPHSLRLHDPSAPPAAAPPDMDHPLPLASAVHALASPDTPALAPLPMHLSGVHPRPLVTVCAKTLANTGYALHAALPALWAEFAAVVAHMLPLPAAGSCPRCAQPWARCDCAGTVVDAALDAGYAHVSHLLGALELLLAQRFCGAVEAEVGAAVRGLFARQWENPATLVEVRAKLLELFQDMVAHHAALLAAGVRESRVLLRSVFESVCQQWARAVMRVSSASLNGGKLLRVETLFVRAAVKELLGEDPRVEAALAHVDALLEDELARPDRPETYTDALATPASEEHVRKELLEAVRATRWSLRGLRVPGAAVTRDPRVDELVSRLRGAGAWRGDGSGDGEATEAAHVRVVLHHREGRRAPELPERPGRRKAVSPEPTRAQADAEAEEKRGDAATEDSDDDGDERLKELERRLRRKPVDAKPDAKPVAKPDSKADSKADKAQRERERARKAEEDAAEERARAEEAKAQKKAERERRREAARAEEEAARQREDEEAARAEEKKRRRKAEKAEKRRKAAEERAETAPAPAQAADDMDEDAAAAAERARKTKKLRVKKMKDGRIIDLDTGKEIDLSKRKVLSSRAL